MCLSPAFGILAGALVLILAGGAIVWVGLLTAWRLVFDMFSATGDFGTDVLYVTTEVYAADWLMVLSVIAIIAPTLVILGTYLADTGLPRLTGRKRAPEKPDDIINVIVIILFYVLNVAWWALLLMAGVFLAVSKAVCVAHVKIAWIHLRVGDRAGG